MAFIWWRGGVATAALALLLAPGSAATQAPAAGWPAYGGDAGGSRYSSARQITRDNVAGLSVAWIYRTGDYLFGDRDIRSESTPILVDGTLYVSTPFGRVIALAPETGVERWSYDPRIDLSGDFGDFANRGVAAWLDRRAPAGAVCRRRIFVAPIDARLIALDAASGKPCGGFGTAGQVDLNRDLMHAPTYQGEYQVTSPPAVAGDVVIIGSAIADNQRVNAPSGKVRAFDARNGTLLWSWDPIPRAAGLPGYDTWKFPAAERTGAANAWSVMSVDTALGLVFVPIGSASPDFYGGERLGQNLFANSLVALRASDGHLVWHFQAVHHDLWDYDVPAQPTLVTLRREGKSIPAVVQQTKMGFVHVLDRRTGTPLFPVVERAVPKSDVSGEEAWPTQPFPTAPLPLESSTFIPDSAWGVTPDGRASCRGQLVGARAEGIFTPPSVRGTIIYPGNIGGGNWSGVAVDPMRGLLVTPINRFATLVTLIPRDSLSAARRAHPGAEISDQRGTAYGMMRQWPRGPDGAPCSPPPWGQLIAVNLASGAERWRVPLGAIPPLTRVPGSAGWGSINLGGAIVTAGGLVFIAATLDQRLRAFDIETGTELWAAPLPAGGHALPMTYQLSDTGRQYVVISAGGYAQLGTTLGDYVIAFALPRPGVTTAPPAPASFTGTYAGEIIPERRRIAASLTLHEDSAGTVTGAMTTHDPAITGTLTGTRAGGTLTYRIAFGIPAQSCSGTIEGTAELANEGRLLVGGFHVSGECSGAEPEDGTLAMRRP
ncbi:MAG TPA: pyrroloquinoline quinone-dependent dehydrogenase [Gemmatimonadales bacterium]